MDTSEIVVEKLLKHRGFQSVVYEPDGNVPPDFLVDGRIAIEVRRLNLNYDAGNGNRGLEETSIPLWQKIEKLGHSFGPTKNESWLLIFRFSRPLEPWKSLRRKLHAALEAFKNETVRTSGIVTVYAEEDFELKVVRASEPLEHFYRMGSGTDLQSTGFILAQMLDNIAYCATEKLQKIAKHRSKYPEWWLVLTNHIPTFQLNVENKQLLLDYAQRPHGWDKVVVVSSMDHTNWLEL